MLIFNQRTKSEVILGRQRPPSFESFYEESLQPLDIDAAWYIDKKIDWQQLELRLSGILKVWDLSAMPAVSTSYFSSELPADISTCFGQRFPLVTDSSLARPLRTVTMARPPGSTSLPSNGITSYFDAKQGKNPTLLDS